MSLPISERRSAERLKRLQRNTEYNALLSNLTSKADDAATPASAASAADGVMSLPIAERRSAEKRKRQQRNDEYNQLVIAAERRRASDNILDEYFSAVADDLPDTAALSLPISERLSAQKRKELERNREYNEFLQSRGLATADLSSATISAADFPRSLDRLDERLERRKTRMRTTSRSRSVDSRLIRRRPRSDNDARPAEV